MWILPFHHTLLKKSLEVDLKWIPFKWNWLLFKNFFQWPKGLLYKKGEKLFVWSFSQCKEILFSKWVLLLFLHWHILFCTKFCKVDTCFWLEELFIWETRRDKKGGVDDKTEKGNLFHHFFIELFLEHNTENETGAFGTSPDKGNRVRYFVYTLPFFVTNQFISKQSSHVKLLMLTQAHRNRGAGGRIDWNY